MKLADIRPQHLNLLYEQLSQPGIRGGFTEKAYAKVDFKALLKEKALTMHGLEVKLPGNKHHSILNLCSGGAVKAETAKMIADVLEMPATALFRFETDSRPLSGSTIGGYHTICHMAFPAKYYSKDAIGQKCAFTVYKFSEYDSMPRFVYAYKNIAA